MGPQTGPQKKLRVRLQLSQDLGPQTDLQWEPQLGLRMGPRLSQLLGQQLKLRVRLQLIQLLGPQLSLVLPIGLELNIFFEKEGSEEIFILILTSSLTSLQQQTRSQEEDLNSSKLHVEVIADTFAKFQRGLVALKTSVQDAHKDDKRKTFYDYDKKT